MGTNKRQNKVENLSKKEKQNE